MEDVEKIRKNLQSDMIVLFILELIILVFNVVNFSIVGIIASAVIAILLMTGYQKAKNREESAWVIGVVVGILMMLTILLGDIIDFLLGLFVLTHSLKYKKTF